MSDKAELLAQSLFDHGYVLDEEDVEESMDDAQVVALLEMLVDAMSRRWSDWRFCELNPNRNERI